ncbi:MAG: MXAN_5187 C-terminal domain-containing protein [Myxococcota bacterium]|nr:MXAN_5187 C-terminal domain-containing protein [Myxococcota bacterium]
MIRIKLIGIIVVLFSTLGFLVYGEVTTRVDKAAMKDVESQLNRARTTVLLRRSLLDHAILERAETIAQTPKIAALLAAKPTPPGSEGDEIQDAPSIEDFAYKIHQDVYEEVLVWNARLKAQEQTFRRPDSLAHLAAGAPDFLAVVNREGQGVAESKDAARYGKTADYGKSFPAILSSIKTGQAVKDVWTLRGGPMAVSVAPIRSTAGVSLGAVIVGYNLAVAAAKSAQQYAQADVAYHIGGRTAGSSSLPARVEAGFDSALKTQLKAAKTDRGMFDVDLGTDKYKVSWTTLNNYASKGTTIAVLVNCSAALRDVKRGLLIIPMIIIIIAFLAGIGIILVFSKYDAQFRSLDKGVLEIINGGLDYWFEVEGTGVASKMAQNLNIMVCQLSGRPLPEEDGEVHTQHWASDNLFVDSIDPGQIKEHETVDTSIIDTGQMATMSKEMASLIRDDEETYLKNVYQRYLDALRGAGQPADNIPYPGFVEQLTSHANRLKTEIGCKRVRFLVEIEAGKATLKPVPLD